MTTTIINKNESPPAASAALNDTDNLLGRYRVMKLVPEPCANAVEQQIAVSQTGANNNNNKTNNKKQQNHNNN